jgi:hypothetical protein
MEKVLGSLYFAIVTICGMRPTTVFVLVIAVLAALAFPYYDAPTGAAAVHSAPSPSLSIIPSVVNLVYSWFKSTTPTSPKTEATFWIWNQWMDHDIDSEVQWEDDSEGTFWIWMDWMDWLIPDPQVQKHQNSHVNRQDLGSSIIDSFLIKIRQSALYCAAIAEPLVSFLKEASVRFVHNMHMRFCHWMQIQTTVNSDHAATNLTSVVNFSDADETQSVVFEEPFSSLTSQDDEVTLLDSDSRAFSSVFNSVVVNETQIPLLDEVYWLSHLQEENMVLYNVSPTLVSELELLSTVSKLSSFTWSAGDYKMDALSLHLPDITYWRYSVQAFFTRGVCMMAVHLVTCSFFVYLFYFWRQKSTELILWEEYQRLHHEIDQAWEKSVHEFYSRMAGMRIVELDEEEID